MIVLVVGGAGYIGSCTAWALRHAGHQVRMYDNLSTGHSFLASGFELIVADIAQADALAKAMKGVNAIMHFAAHAYVGESVDQPRKYFANNVTSGLTLLNTAIDHGIDTFVFSSSCAVYGVPAQIPISENTVRAPINPYGVSKLFFEDALDSYDKAYSLRSARLRYFNAAGAHESGVIGELHDPETHLIPRALQAASGTSPPLRIFGDDYETADGTCVRDYVHVSDLAEAHVMALENLRTTRRSFSVNLGGGRGYSVQEVLAAVHQLTGRRVPSVYAPRRPGDPPVLVADAKRARQLLGWNAKRDLMDIISTAWKWEQRIQQVARRELRASA